MIQTELLNDGTLIRHYSDDGHDLLQVETGIVYGEAVDIYPCPYTYEEVERENDENDDNDINDDEE